MLEARTFMPSPEILKTSQELPPTHEWLKRGGRVAFMPALKDPLLEAFYPSLVRAFKTQGNRVVRPEDEPEAIINTALFNEPIPVQEALFLNSRRRFNLRKHPVVFTLVSLDQEEMEETLQVLSSLETSCPSAPEDFPLVGLNPNEPERALKQLQNQVREGGSLLGLSRLLQVQTKNLNVVAVVGEREKARIDSFFRFDLAGGRAEIQVAQGQEDQALENLTLRFMTFLQANQATEHLRLKAGFSLAKAERMMSESGQILKEASLALARFGFFPEPVDVEGLSGVPLLGILIKRNYSAGCLGVRDKNSKILVATATGSRDERVVDKRSLEEKDLAFILAKPRPRLEGAYVLETGIGSLKPSSESVEMAAMASSFPKLQAWAHSHTMVVDYDPNQVKMINLRPSYWHYPVSCATRELALATVEALKDSQENDKHFLNYKLYVLVQPCHGIWLLERFQEGRKPFSLILGLLEKGRLKLDSKAIPQG